MPQVFERRRATLKARNDALRAWREGRLRGSTLRDDQARVTSSTASSVAATARAASGSIPINLRPVAGRFSDVAASPLVTCWADGGNVNAARSAGPALLHSTSGGACVAGVDWPSQHRAKHRSRRCCSPLRYLSLGPWLRLRHSRRGQGLYAHHKLAPTKVSPRGNTTNLRYELRHVAAF